MDPSSASPRLLRLCEGKGVEVELMVVDRETLAIRPIADLLFERAAGASVRSVERGAIDWSNELVLHVVELKTHGPCASLAGVAEALHREILTIHSLLEPLGARLMPTAMHPFMRPAHETRLWPHEDEAIYRTYHHIFDCRGHGWANLQSVHLNLSFADDEELGELLCAIRLVLPLVPAIAASSPMVEGRLTGAPDNRLLFYRDHVARVPELIGDVIPEPVYDRASYEAAILGRIHAALAPHDSEGTLRAEWVNSRGAIVRFDRMAVELRLTDVQECPKADMAIAAFLTEAVRYVIRSGAFARRAARELPTQRLSDHLFRCATEGRNARIDDPLYMEALGLRPRRRANAQEVAIALFEASWPTEGDVFEELTASACALLELGPLAERIRRALGSEEPRHSRVRWVYGELCDHLHHNRIFRPTGG